MLSMSKPAAPRPLRVIARPLPAPRLQVHGVASPGRAQVESFVAAIYRRRFGAEVKQFAPVLVSLHDEDGQRVAVAGYRAAQLGPLFLERYLSSPVQTLLPAADGAEPSRKGIVEVGHLAALRAGEGRRLIRLLGPHLVAQGFDWAVSTLTQELRNLLVRMGVTPLALGVADPALLGEQAAQWGSYYDHKPLVLAGRLDTASRVLVRHAGAA